MNQQQLDIPDTGCDKAACVGACLDLARRLFQLRTTTRQVAWAVSSKLPGTAPEEAGDPRVEQ